MHLDWIMSPVTQGALTAVGLGLALYLFCTLKIDIRAVERRAKPQPAPTSLEIDALRQRVDDLAALERENREQTERAGTGIAMRPGLNLSRRTQALRLHRRGDRPEQIASSLGVPTGEVHLLLKVHRILLDQALATRPGAALKPGPHSADMSQEQGEETGGARRTNIKPGVL